MGRKHNNNTSTMQRSSFLFISFLLILPPNALSSPTRSTSTVKQEGHFTKIYAFGDSYTDTGNTLSFGYVLTPPYGSTYFHKSTNRYSDGRLVVDFLTTTLSLPFLPPYLNRGADFSHGVNFAVAGSTALDHEFFVQNNITFGITMQSLMTQQMWFEKHLEEKGCKVKGSPECQAHFEDALFWVGEIGANDYAYSFASSLSPHVIQQLAVEKVFNFLLALLDRGAKYIVVQGLPLTGCLPLSLTLAPPYDRDDLGCVASVNWQVYNHNQLLQNKLQELRQRYHDAIISYADFYSAYRQIMKNSDYFGLTDRFKVCCGTGDNPYNFNPFATCGSPVVSKACSQPNKFVNWDGVHLTEAMYKVVAGMFFQHGYCRPSFDVLLKTKSQNILK